MTPIPAIFEPVADVFAPVAPILEPVTDVFAAVAPILEPVAPSAVVTRVATVFHPVADILAPITPVLQPIAVIFTSIPHVLHPIPDDGPAGRSLRHQRRSTNHDEQCRGGQRIEGTSGRTHNDQPPVRFQLPGW
jgi:hypothetical protein